MKRVYHLSCLTLLILISITAYSQTPVFTQPIIAGEAVGNEKITAMVGDNNGNIYVTGTFSSAPFNLGGFTLSTIGTSNIFVAKYDVSGNVLWAKSPINDLADSATSIAIDPAGNIYVTGFFSSTVLDFGGSFVITNTNSGIDIFIVKFDPTGNIIWAKREGDTGDDKANDIAIDDNFNMYIVGNYTSSNLILGSTTLSYSGGQDVFYAKYDTSGTIIWANSTGNGFEVNAKAITVDGNGNSYITGSFSTSTLTFGSLSGLGNNGDYDWYIVKIDPSGNAVWADASPSITGNSNTDIGTDIVAKHNGDVYLTGSFKSNQLNFGTHTINNSSAGGGAYDIFVAKYRDDGTVEWAKSVGGSGDDMVSSITRDNCGYVYVSGKDNSGLITFAGTSLMNGSLPHNDMLLLKYDDDGDEVWGKSSGGSDEDQGTAVTQSSDNNMVVAGYTNSATITLDASSSLNSSGVNDFFLAKVQTTATDIFVYVDTAGPVTAGKVYLYARQQNYQYLHPLDSALLGLESPPNMVHFAGVQNLNYFVKVIADTAVYPNLMPTYNGDFTLWNPIAVWTHSCSSNDTVYVAMQTLQNAGGVGKANGYVYKAPGFGRDERNDPIPGLDVKVGHNPAGTIAAYTTTDINGHYSTANLDTGSYTIYIDIPGLDQVATYDFTISAGSPTFTLLNFCADSMNVDTCGQLPVGINSNEKNNVISIYPNPGTGIFTIDYSTATITGIEIYNLIGELIVREEPNKSSAIINLSTKEKGIYFVRIKDENNNVVNRKIIKN